jgi:hypothetical protein
MKRLKFFLSSGIALANIILLYSGCSHTTPDHPSELQPKTYIVYEEAVDPDPADPALWESVSESLQGSFGTKDIRYDKSAPPKVDDVHTTWKTFAWKGERVSNQIVLWSAADQGTLHFEWSAFSSAEGTELPSSSLQARFVRFVLTDEYAGGCTPHKVEGQQVSLAPDPIDEVEMLNYCGKTTRPVWVSIDVPENISSGIFSGNLFVKSSLGEELTFDIALEVGELVLPNPSQWTYHLDLWQNPSAVARYHQVEPWSEEHYKYLEPLIKLLASAGQKVITTSIIHRPWNGQTQDAYRGMIDWHKKSDGQWVFDYTVFDRWVDFVESCGIKDQINCYTMIPWGNRFLYFDEEKGMVDTLVARPGSEAYENHWKPFLTNFSEHLKQKGWFDKTAIAMDERPVEDMEKAIALIQKTVPDLKITLAGGYHPEIEEDLFDMCVASEHQVPEEVIRKRNAAGKFTTYYTCCVEPYPNNFTFSPPAESTWQAWYAAHKGFSGYLRWAFMSWVLEPLKDSRFRNWPAGDTYFVYPEARTSIRFERLREGIQDFEKIRIIREKLKTKNTQEARDGLKLLEEHLQKYEISALENTPSAVMLQEGKSILDRLSKQSL